MKKIIVSSMLALALLVAPVAFAQTTTDTGTTTDTTTDTTDPSGGVEAGLGPVALYAILSLVLFVGGVALLATRKPEFGQE